MNILRKAALWATIVFWMLWAHAQNAVDTIKGQLHPALTTDQSGDSLGTIDSSAIHTTPTIVANESKTDQNHHNHQANDLTVALLWGWEGPHGWEFAYGRVLPVTDDLSVAMGSWAFASSEGIGLTPYLGLWWKLTQNFEAGLEWGPIIRRDLHHDPLSDHGPWEVWWKAWAYGRVVHSDKLDVYLNGGVEMSRRDGRLGFDGAYTGVTFSLPAWKEKEETAPDLTPLQEEMSTNVPTSAQQGGGWWKHHGHGWGHNHNH